MTEYPTSAMNTANAIVRQSSNAMGAPTVVSASWVMFTLLLVAGQFN
jgi:hypothetical protein